MKFCFPYQDDVKCLYFRDFDKQAVVKMIIWFYQLG